MDYKAMLMKLLGAPADATDEQLQSLCDAHTQEMTDAKAECADLKSRNTTLTAELAEHDLAEFAGVIKDRDGTKAQLIKDRAGTLIVLRGLNTEGGKLLSRADGKPPRREDSEAKDRERESFIDGLITSHRLSSRSQAIDLARTLRADLFT